MKKEDRERLAERDMYSSLMVRASRRLQFAASRLRRTTIYCQSLNGPAPQQDTEKHVYKTRESSKKEERKRLRRHGGVGRAPKHATGRECNGS